MDIDISYFLLAFGIFPAQPFWVCYDAMLVALMFATVCIGGSRRRFKTWRRTEAWRINIDDRQFLNFFIWMGGDYLTLSFAEKSRVLDWSIKRKITHNCSNVFNVQWKFKYFFWPRFPPSTACFRNLPRQLTSSNYFITSKFSRAVYFFKFFVISNVGMICN